MSTLTVPSVQRSPVLTSALRLALSFALAKLALQVAANLWQAHLGWGYFRDEFYYLACGRHLAWGYVDHGPLVALQARLAETLFGHSLAGLRLPAALAGAARIALTGLLAFALGGRRAAQSLAMLGVLIAPAYLAIDSFLSMNSFESLFWMSCLLALITLQHRLGDSRPLSQPPSSRPKAERSAAEAERPPHFANPLTPTGVPHPLQLFRHHWYVSSLKSTKHRPDRRTPLTLWLLFGLSAGLGLLNKPSMTFFLVALGIALLLTRSGRTLLLRREALAGVALLILIALPNLLWQIHHHWPTLEFLHTGRVRGKNAILGPVAFLTAQIQTLSPVTIFLWLPGLVWLLRRPAWRWIGLTFLLFFVSMFALHAKDYYVTPVYPVLFAAGGIVWEQRRWRPFGRLSAAAPEARADRLLAFPLYQATLLVTGILLLPMAIPVLSPQVWLRYASALHLRNIVSNAETARTGPFPQFFADRFGWQEYLDIVTGAYIALSPEDRARVLLFTNDYGEAGALDILGSYEHRNLPPAASGQNNYWLWGTHGRDPDLVIAIVRDTPEALATRYDSVTIVGHMSHPFAMPHEHRNVYLLRHRRPATPFRWQDERYFY